MLRSSAWFSILAAIALGVPAVAIADDFDRARALLHDLDVEDATRREAATDDLVRLGEQAPSEALERIVVQTAKEGSAETAARCGRVIEAIRYWERMIVVRRPCAGCVDLRDGSFSWKQAEEKWARWAWSDEPARGAQAYVAGQEGGLTCRDLRTGEVRWEVAGLADGDRLGTDRWIGYRDDRLACADLRTGRLVWDELLPAGERGARIERAAAGVDRVYADTGNGLAALNAGDGKVIARTGPLWVESVVAFERGMVATTRSTDEAGGVVALRTDGREAWEEPLPKRAYRDPFVLGDRVVVSFGEFETWTTQALSIDTGEVAWEMPGVVTAACGSAREGQAWLATTFTDGEKVELLAVHLSDGQVERRLSLPRSVRWLLREGKVLYASERAERWGQGCHISSAPACGLEAFDTEAGRRLWTSPVRGTEGLDGCYENVTYLRRIGGHLVLVAEDMAPVGTVEVVDPADGRIIARHLIR